MPTYNELKKQGKEADRKQLLDKIAAEDKPTYKKELPSGTMYNKYDAVSGPKHKGSDSEQRRRSKKQMDARWSKSYRDRKKAARSKLGQLNGGSQ